jgi:hypothetical protein
MGGACGTYGRGQRCAQGVGGEARRKEAIRGRPPDVDGRIILRWIFRLWGLDGDKIK